MYDIHCHLPFDISDGPSERSESVEMLRIAAEAGVTGINAVAHFGNYLRELQDRIEVLRPEAEALGITLHAGFEYDFSDLAECGDDPRLVTVSDCSRYVLIDFCSSNLPYFAGMKFYQLAGRGYRFIIVHPEVLFTRHDLKQLSELQRQNAVIQLNASSFLPESAPAVRNLAHDLIRCGLAQAVASDAHRATGRRRNALPEARAAVSRRHGTEVAELLFDLNPQRLWENLHPLELPVPPLSRWQKWRLGL